MKRKLLYVLGSLIVLLGGMVIFSPKTLNQIKLSAVSVFNSAQVGTGAVVNGLLQTNGTISSWVTSISPATLNSVVQVPSDFATNGCGGSATTTDFGGCVNLLYSKFSVGTYNGIKVPCINVTQSQWLTPIIFGTSAVDISFFSDCEPTLHYGGTGAAVTFNAHNSYGHIKTEDYGILYYGSSTPIYGGLPNTATTTAIVCGGANGCVGIDFHDNSINGFGTSIHTTSNSYLNTFTNNAISGWNGGVGYAVLIDSANNSGESLAFNDNSITDGGNSTGTKAFYISDNASQKLSISGGSIDDAQIYLGIANQLTVDHVWFENADFSQYPGYAFIYATSSSASALSVTNSLFYNGANTGASSPPEFIEEAVANAYFAGNYFDKYGNQVVTTAIDHSIGASIPNEIFCSNKNQNTAYTNLANNLPDSIASQNAGCWSESANSYATAILSNGSNVNSFYSGSTVVGSYDHSGNWIIPGTITLTGHVQNPTSTVSVSSCGGGASVLGSDNAGALTVGSSTAGCTLTFATAWHNVPVCTANGAKNGVVIIIRSITLTTTTANFADSAAFPTSSIIDYICTGNPN